MSVVPHSDCFCDSCVIKYYKQGLIHEGTPAYDDVMGLLNNRKTKVISGFPGVGKSVLTRESHCEVLDSDSISFSWLSEGVRHPGFPNNYMEHIKNNLGKVDYIFVSSHDIVRKALRDNDIQYTLVYPAIELKEEYIERYKYRGNNEGFIKFIGSKWDEFVTDIEKETFPELIKLESGQYLSDALKV